MNVKGIMHAHSRYSYDADIPLEDLRERLRSHGLSFACMTEHTDELSPERAEAFIRECRERSDEQFVFVPGFEMPYLGTHILVIGASAYGYDENDAESSLRRWGDGGAFAIIAHPHRNGFETDEFMRSRCVGVEAWNSQYDGKYAPRPRAMGLFRRLRKERPDFLVFAGLDLHRPSHLGGPALIMELPALSELAIREAMAAGRYRIEGRAASLASDGTLLWPTSFGAMLFGYLSLGIVGSVRVASKIAKKLGLQETGLFRWGREQVRKYL